jgi:hypothetical protein
VRHLLKIFEEQVGEVGTGGESDSGGVQFTCINKFYRFPRSRFHCDFVDSSLMEVLCRNSPQIVEIALKETRKIQPHNLQKKHPYRPSERGRVDCTNLFLLLAAPLLQFSP